MILALTRTIVSVVTATGKRPAPIPNPEAKPDSADGTAPARVRESRTPPSTHHTVGPEPPTSGPGPTAFLQSPGSTKNPRDRPPLPPPLTYHHQPPKNTNTADIFAHAPHPSEREPLRHLLALRVGSSQAFKNGKGTDGSPGSKVGPWRIRTVGTMRTTATRPGIVGTVTVTASVDASASMTGTTVLVAAITPVGAATRTMGGGVPRAASAMRAGPAQSTDGGMTGAQSAVGTEARTNGAQSAVITNLGVPTAAPEAEAPGRGRTSVEVARRSASASPSPVSPTTSNRATLSGAQRASFVPWDAPMPRTSPATW